LSLSGSQNAKISVLGLSWKQENLLMPGHYEFLLQVNKEGQENIQINRRYSDFDLLRRTLECMHPGLFIVPLPPKDKFISL
jgi:hypothetical protein